MIGTLKKLLAPSNSTGSIEQIARLNDAFRARPYATPNSRVLFTAGVMALATNTDHTSSLAAAMFAQNQMLLLVGAAFAEPIFDPCDDRRTGTIDFQGQVIVFRIAYLTLDLKRPARDPADEQRTARVMVLSLPDEGTRYG